ncbi:MAG: hypothetical protein ACTSXQ_03330 [Alphaproteobacteria bacterium]
MKLLYRVSTLVLFFMLTTSCSGLLPDTDYPEKRFYALDLMRSKGNRRPTSPLILKVRNFKISPTFNGRNFTHKISRYSYDTDFYNAFFIPVQLNMMELTENWLSNADIFSLVISGRNALPSDLILEANISEIYADHSKGKKANAVLRMKFFVTSTMNPDSRLFLAKEYQRIIPLRNREAATLVKGWNLAFQRILEAFESDLRRLASKRNAAIRNANTDDGESTVETVKGYITSGKDTIVEGAGDLIKGAGKTTGRVKGFIQDVVE